MWLKNIDTYIKDKLKGYKPAFQEDLWKGIEEHLPPSKVPDGQGSWLIAAAAAIVVIIMVPFFLKFNNAVEERQAHEQVSSNVKSNNIQTPRDISENSVSGKMTNHAATGENGSSLKPVEHIELRSTSTSTSGNQKYQKKVFYHGDHPVSNQLVHQDIRDKKIGINSKENQEDHVERQLTVKSFMRHLLAKLLPEQIENELTLNEKNKRDEDNNNKYKNHVAQTTHNDWANWQSIFYPFWENPAYTGAEGRYNFIADDKQEYVPEAKTSKILNNFAFDMRIPSAGIGIGIFNSRELTQFSLQSTYGISVSKIVFHKKNSVLKIGVAATMINNTLFYNSLNFSDQVSPIWGFIYPTREKDPSETTSSFGLNAGIWYNNKNIMGGLDVTNLNQPRPHHLSEAQPLPSLWRATAGYHFAIGNNFQFLPMVELHRQDKVNQLNTTITAVYKNKFMATIAYQDISPKSSLGNLYFYAGVDLFKKFRVFAGYGVNTELQQIGINDHFVHGGIKFQIR